MSNWYCLVAGKQYGPVSREQLQAWVLTGHVRPGDLVWTDGMGQWQPVAQVPELRPATDETAGQTPPPAPPAAGVSDAANRKIVAGVLAILLGTLVVHKFYLGYTTAGIIMLVITVATCGVGSIVTWIIALIEGLTYLTMPDPRFEETYLIGQKPWF